VTLAVGVLERAEVRLEPLALSHTAALTEAATRDRSTYGLAPVPRDADETARYVADALADQAAGRGLPFAVVRPAAAGGRVVGSIRFMSLEWWRWPPGPIAVAGEPRQSPADPPDVVEIGHAWLEPGAQRTGVFPASCLLMLAHAFEAFGVHRVTLKTDARNARSRAAIAKVGGRFEGILRAHLPAADGRVRDTAMFSIVAAEWPTAREQLESTLAAAQNRRGQP
jgi:RimJ/RimL family protein N-acetyltransferase